MKYFRGLKISLVAKLVLAFVLVAVIPMLVASKITTELIADVVNRNIERWLGEATTYMRHSVEETHERLKAVSRLLDTRFDGKDDPQQREAAALSFMDIDALWLRDAEGAALRHPARRPDRGAAVSRRPVQLGPHGRRYAAGRRHERTGIHGGRRQGPYPPACQLVQHRLLGQQRQRR
ncbi:MAG: hypothetical protein ACLRWP_17850 [Bilophila wadsworthia]